jgi:predicted Zn-dependent peptidase
MKIQIKRRSFDNGLNLILAPNYRIPLTSISVAYNLSTKDILKRKVGLPHFTEHMTFLMRIAGRKRADFSRYISSIGGKSWAETREDYILFNSIFPCKKFPYFLKLEAKRMNLLHFDRETFLFEKIKIKRERFLLYINKPYLYSLDELLKEAFENTPYSRLLIGTQEEIEAIEIQDINNFYEDYFAPNNALIIVAGNFNDNEVLDSIAYYFKGIHSSIKLDPFMLNKPYFTSKITIVSLKNTIDPAAHFAFRIIPQGCESNYIYYLLEYIINNEMIKKFDKLFYNDQRVVFKFIANYLEKPNLSLFIIFVHLRNRSKVKNIIKYFFQRLEMIKLNIKEDIVESAKLTLLSEIYKGPNVFTNKTKIFTKYILFGSDPLKINLEIEEFKNITKKDLLMILEKYFVLENMVFVGTNLKE